jgi:hypothetical protein
MTTPPPTVFVAMPFATKRDALLGVDVDFDQVYADGIRPVLTELGLRFVRADEAGPADVAHRFMFEQLIGSDIAIVDVTLRNPNVLYELGVRHATRPGTTIVLDAGTDALPFTISLVDALPYRLTRGRLADVDAIALRSSLTRALSTAIAAGHPTDSPLFALLAAAQRAKIQNPVA